ncbi:hypothetical protein QVD17_27776 [Tagetes erecta]|uniref:Uncharacterized protein n=1 Tax=Tagetes erecta TaxID=13708 RepID=A0AAD8KCJ6_TARER|nr:hypothetical protein QVD17_27776 [Tagetes erecta]
MTVLRSRKNASSKQKLLSSKSGVEIEPVTPAKEVEISNNLSYPDTPSSGCMDLGSVSNRGLRRSARLSLNPRLSNVVKSVGCRRKRKAVSVEKCEEGSVDVGVSMELDTPGIVEGNADKERESKVKVQKVSGLDFGEVCVELEKDGGVGRECLRLRSGKKLLKREVDDLVLDGNLFANKKEREDSERVAVVKKEEVVVDGEETNVDLGSDVVIRDRSRLSVEEKGKWKAEMANPSAEFSNMDVVQGKPEEGSLVDTEMADVVSLEEKPVERAGSSNKMDPKERFKNVAKENASKFAHFSIQEEDVDDDELEPQVEANGDVEDWPGPFSTAMKIIKDRASNMPTEQKKKSDSAPLIWVPKKNNQHGLFKRVVPSLEELCIEIMAENVDSITSLESVPDAIRHKLTQALCDSRKMNRHFLNLLASKSPSEIRIKDCSWLDEDHFSKTFEAIDASNLTVLQLDQCGRCLPDYVLHTTLKHLPSKLSALTNISLKGACRLSDAGLDALVTSASTLRSINLGCCSLLTSDSINNLADKLGSVLKELYIDECFGLDAKLILPALFKLQHLEVLSISRFETVNDSFITQFVAVQGHKMKELVLADCTRLTDRAIKAIAKSCPGLCAIDLTNLFKLTDTSIGHLANGCQTIQTMKFRRNAFSDEAVAAYLEACGGPLTELSLNHVDKVGHQTALSLAKHAKKLQSLDLSWCRDMTDEAVGLIVDSCLSLEMLKLFGCTQITNVFTNGHSNENVKVIGLQESQILKNIALPNLLPLRYSSV